MDPGSAAHHAARHSASKTRVNALMALRSIRGTYPSSLPQLQTCLHDLAARCARGLQKIFGPLEGVGNAGCPLHPRSRVHLVVLERTRVTTSTPESPGIPARNGFNGSFVLSPVTGLFCHRRQRICGSPKPGRADLPSANLTPASGRQDHTTSPYAAIVTRPRAGESLTSLSTRPAITSRAKRCRVHRIPPRVRDDGQRPSGGVGCPEF
jgi:hypothetical protein